MKRLPRAYKRDKRKEQIRVQFSVWHRNGDCEHKTMPRIAKALGMVPSQKLHQILGEMVVAGDMTVEERDRAGRWTTKFYLLVEKHLITKKYSRRHISVKSRGVAVGQLEMFS
jgi:hypothetical protein